MDAFEVTSLGSGWLALALVFFAGAIPVAHRMRVGRRAAPDSAPIGLHVALGLAVVGAAFIHSVLGVLSLGYPRAIGASEAAIWAGVFAALVLMAHVGIGLQLRNPKLRERTQRRRWHLATALTIAACAVAHTVLLCLVDV